MVANAKLAPRPAYQVRTCLHYQFIFAKDRRDDDGTRIFVGRKVQFEDHRVLTFFLSFFLKRDKHEALPCIVYHGVNGLHRGVNWNQVKVSGGQVWESTPLHGSQPSHSAG